jgi:Transposase IS4
VSQTGSFVERSDDEDQIETQIDAIDISWQISESPVNHPSLPSAWFTGPTPGPILPVENVLECTELFLKPRLIEKICAHTNAYAMSPEGQRRKRRRDTDHREVTVQEMWLFIALIVLMEIHGKHSIDSYWTTDPFFATPIFSAIMPVDRFRYILSMLSFCSYQDVSNEERVADQLWKIRDVFEEMNESFSSAYNLEQNVSVDESLLLWKGHHGLQRYIPSKADRWGLKFYALAESRTGYIYRLLADEGSNTRITTHFGMEPLQKPGKVVMTLMEPILGRGHLLGIDNFYTDIPLFMLLKCQSTDCIGTIRKNRRHLPDQIKKTWKKSDRNKIVVAHSDHLLLINWMDRREVRMLATTGSASFIDNKPNIVNMYNEVMPGVDSADQMRHGRTVARRRLRDWETKFFLYLIDVSLVNAYTIGKHVRTMSHITHQRFRESLVKRLVFKYAPDFCLPCTNSPAPRPLLQSPAHLFIINMPNKDRRRCRVCMKKTPFKCRDCDAFICLGDCYVTFHNSFINSENTE